jgi:hypothetical protein
VRIRTQSLLGVAPPSGVHARHLACSSDPSATTTAPVLPHSIAHGVYVLATPTGEVVNLTYRTEEELRELARIPAIRASVRSRIQPLCEHFPREDLDRLLDDIALLQYRYERRLLL